MKKIEPKGRQKLVGYTVYLTKQASKLLGTPTIEVDGSTYPKFDLTREMWQLPYMFELSKESVLMIEYHHEVTRECFAKTNPSKTGEEENKQELYHYKGGGINISVPMFPTNMEEEMNKVMIEEMNKSVTKEINKSLQKGLNLY